MVNPEAEAESRVVDLDELVVRPGTYFNPQTEVVVIVDDSASVDQEIFDMEAYEGADWVHVTDDVPVDSDSLDAALERFQTTYHAGAAGAAREAADDEELEPDPDRDEETGLGDENEEEP
jgi:hypothetical protein